MAELIGLSAKLKRAGYKLTAPRRTVVQVLENEGEHLSSNEVLELGRQTHPTLSRATVYRTLELLTELGLVRPILLGDTSQRYVASEGGHHHLVCSDCGAVLDFDRCGVDRLADSLAEQHGFQIRSHLLEFYGTCRECQAQD
jgi:Fur family transcriptional regulator, ferric uptake regulator